MSSLAQKKQERAAQDEREAEEEQRAQRVQQEQDRHERYLNAVREFVKREPIGGISSTHAFLSPFKTSHEPTSGEHRSNVATFPHLHLTTLVYQKDGTPLPHCVWMTTVLRLAATSRMPSLPVSRM